MAKKKTDFNFDNELEALPCPDWFKKAFVKTIDVAKIKSKSDFDKAIKTYGEMK